MKRGIPILIHSVCLSNFCRNSIAVARWGGGLIRWGKCFWKRLQIRNSRTWKNSVLGIPGNQQPAFPLLGFLSPQFSTFRLQLSESFPPLLLALIFGWSLGKSIFWRPEGGMVKTGFCCCFFRFLGVWRFVWFPATVCNWQPCHVVVTRFSIGSTIWHADEVVTFLCVFLFTLR